MDGTKLLPEKITSPFQLMAAWFAMLVLLVSILLAAAINITKPDWAAGYLIIFTSILIVLVLGCVTLMLTVFRPNLQDGKEYAQWLKDKNTYSSGIISSDQISSKSQIRRTIKSSKIKNLDRKNISISVTNAPDAHTLVDAFRKMGLAAEIYKFSADEDSSKPEDHEAIWVGFAVPAKIAIEAIKIAVSKWSHLKYMHLSNDGGFAPDFVHYEMYFGGATSTAKLYGIAPWSAKELSSLDPDMTGEEFHRLIRSKYP